MGLTLLQGCNSTYHWKPRILCDLVLKTSHGKGTETRCLEQRILATSMLIPTSVSMANAHNTIAVECYILTVDSGPIGWFLRPHPAYDTTCIRQLGWGDLMISFCSITDWPTDYTACSKANHANAEPSFLPCTSQPQRDCPKGLPFAMQKDCV